ncbi:hypothetical protein V7161_30045, partial [Neobacillus drentensis]|uniref:hypothetical protein n=1 Tax=Neobacillus drentensis TaxID=220684 RepID=UPI003001E07F
PTFHILFITFLNFYTLNLFHKFISTRKKMLLIYYLICNTIPILMYYRSLSVFIFIGSLFIFLFSNEKRRIKNKTKIQLVLLVTVFFYLFGILGNIRVNSQIQNGKSAFDSEVILNVGRASDNVRDHELLSPFFWTYLYSTVSLANFQYNIDRHSNNNIQLDSFMKFFKNELIYDFLSKRLWTEEKINHDLIRDDLTTITMFTNSYIALGWFGPLLIFAHIIFLFLVLIFFSPKENDYFVTGLAILCSLILLGTFENMFTYSAFGFTFIYPIIFAQLNKLKGKRIKLN